MTAKVAIATVSGKAYFLLVSELKEKNIEFLSVVPGQPVPAEAKIVITTEKEKSLVRHEKVLIYNGTDPHAIVNEAIKGLQGKESYEKIVIGIDPGEVTGLAVIADGKVNATKACFNIQEITSEVRTTITNLNLESTKVLVKIGNGVPLYKELLAALDSTVSPKVVLEVVSEAGTNKPSGMDKHRRGLRDITSAIRIAGREGYAYHRKIVTESEE